MILKVNKDICEIKQNEVWNVGDYNVHTVQVELSEEFDGLVNKVRYFVEDNSYDMLITDNVAQVPYEATVMEGTIKIGVYGYDADTDILVQSTSPVNKYITSGTYTGEADNTEPLTPTDKQQIESAIQQNTDDITDLKANKQDKLISGENIKTINNESILGSGNIEIGGGGGGTSDYTNLTNKPKINNVELVGNKSLNDLGIQPKGNYALESEIPDVSNFITNTVDDLVNYYTKTETFTKQEVNNLISAITTMDIQVVQTLPVQDISTTTIYLVPKTPTETNDAYDEYIYVSNNWEHIGSTEVDLTDYVKNTDYASYSKGGVIKVDDAFSTFMTDGKLKCSSKTYADYQNSSSYAFISKGTLENVIAGKELVTNQDISGKANKINVVQTSASTIEINPNTFYKFGEVASLNITLATITDNTIYNEYMFEFVSGSTATTLTLPSSIKWLETPTIDANKIYQCSIVDNVGLLVGVTNV